MVQSGKLLAEGKEIRSGWCRHTGREATSGFGADGRRLARWKSPVMLALKGGCDVEDGGGVGSCCRGKMRKWCRVRW